jgi:hypothetical protein
MPSGRLAERLALGSFGQNRSLRLLRAKSASRLLPQFDPEAAAVPIDKSQAQLRRMTDSYIFYVT